MGDNITRKRSVTGGSVIDSWQSVPGAQGNFEITIESIDSGDCPVTVQVIEQTPDTEISDLVTVSGTDRFPSGPHRTIIGGALSGSVQLLALPLSDDDPGTCDVTYTFKWAS